MLVAAVVTFASLLAQAEPAPPEPAPAPAAAPTPAPSMPSAEPAGRPPNALSIYGRFAYRVGDPGQTLGPAAGFSLGGSVERRYLALARGFELGGAIDFFYDRFAMDVTGSTLDQNGNTVPAPGTRTFTHTSFALLQTAALALDSIRPFAAVGAGVDIGYFSSPESDLRPGSQTAVMPLVRGALGIEVPIGGGVAVAVRADYTHLYNRPRYGTTPAGPGLGASLMFWGDLFDVGAGVVAHF
jgi:hypothetical protein